MDEKKKKSPFLDKNKPKGAGGKKQSFYWIYAILAVIFIGFSFMNFDSGAERINWLELKKHLKDNQVKKIVVINKSEAEIYLKDQYLPKTENKSSTLPTYTYTPGSVETFETNVESAQMDVPENQHVYVEYETRSEWGSEILVSLLPFILLIGIWIFIMRMMNRGSGGGAGGGIFSIGKSKAKLFEKDTKVDVSFKDVAGLEEAKVEILEIVDFLKNPKKYTDLGGKIPKGALLVGPPGTGKTLMAKAVAGEAQVPFFSMSGSDFVEMFVGVGASRVRDLFKQAKEKAPCIIFIDEIDAIGRARGKSQFTGGNDERENTLNQLLTEMDGFQGNTGVIILAATNRADVLDRALVRAGRFDRQIHIELPDLDSRRSIFAVHLKPIKTTKDVDVEFLARQTPGFSGADIANVCNEAALIAARKKKDSVGKVDFTDAIDRIVGGLEKKSKIITKREKKVIAYHEAGHAGVSWLLEFAHPLVKVTIVPRGKSLGAAWYLPEERQITTYDQMFDEMVATLAGRASEQVNFGKISTGALNDLEKVTKQAYNMVVYFGMNDRLGNISYYDSTGQREYNFTNPYSEQTAQIIDEEISKLIEKAYQKALEVIGENRDLINQLAELLLEREVIMREDVERIFGPRNFVREKEEAEEREAFLKKRNRHLEDELAKNRVVEDEKKEDLKDDSEIEKDDSKMADNEENNKKKSK